MARAPFVSLDGLDGTGKSTQCRLLAAWLRRRGLKVTLCADPGGTKVGDQLRELLLHRRETQMAPACEALLFMASRAQLVAEVIRPALEAGRAVVCDRFLLANVVYQGHAGGLDVELLWEAGRLSTGGLTPDLTLVLDLSPEKARARRRGPADRVEGRDKKYHARVREGFLAEARRCPERIRVIDAGPSAAEVQEAIRREVARLLQEGLTLVWQRVRGHEAQVEGFRRAVRRGRLAHAYLFTGPAGVGKRLFAVELAKALLCEGNPGDELEACDRCPACAQVEAGAHPDFFPAARPADSFEFPIELMRELCQGFALKSARGRGKVVLIDGADDLNRESANCFLKTLEEPPPRSVLILIGSSPDRQLPTIVSRCQVIRFAPLPAEAVNELLQAQGVDDAALRERLARLSGGSVGRALALAEPELREFRRALLAGLTRVPPDAVGLAKKWLEVVEEAGKEASPQRRRAQLVLRLLVDFLDDALTVSLGGPPRRTEPEDRPALEALAGRVGPEALLAALERCLEADGQIDHRPWVPLPLILEGLLDALAQRLRA